MFWAVSDFGLLSDKLQNQFARAQAGASSGRSACFVLIDLQFVRISAFVLPRYAVKLRRPQTHLRCDYSTLNASLACEQVIFKKKIF